MRIRRGARPAAVIAVAVALAVTAGACSTGANASGGGGDGKVTVVANFYPVWEAAVKVGGDRVDVTNLTPVGAEPHDLELAPDDVNRILDADVVLYMGLGFQPAVEDAARERSDGVTVDLLTGLQPNLQELAAGESLQGGKDPHVWLDPVLYQGIVDEVTAALTQADPAGGSTYQANAKAFTSELAQLDERFRAGLTTCESREIVTAHAAFGYLATRYHLQQIPITGIDPEAEPNPQRLAELADLVERDGITTIFTETLVSPRIAQTLANEVGVATAVLDPLEGLTQQAMDAGRDYISVMDTNLATLRAALRCT